MSVGFAYKNSNNHAKDDFLDGLSAADIHTILYDLFNLKSPLQISTRQLELVYNKLPLIKLTNDFIINGIELGFVDVTCFIRLEEKLKNLFCNTIKYEPVDNMTSKVSLYMSILSKSDLIRKAGINWLFTKKAKQALNDKSILFRAILEGVGYGINWKYFDNIDAKEIGQLAFGISIILLLKYGDEYRSASFYTDKYLHFFDLIKSIPDAPDIISPKNVEEIYSNRTFRCFFKSFGLVDIDESQSEPMFKASEYLYRVFDFNF
jgi:hypothetical protein